MNIEMALKSSSYILDLDRVKLSLGTFFFSVLFNGEFFSPAFMIYLSFDKNTHQKAVNLMFCLILLVAKVPWWFLECNLSTLVEQNGRKLTWLQEIVLSCTLSSKMYLKVQEVPKDPRST